MNEEVFVYDTYALIEIIEGNEKYQDYLDKKIIINDFIFAEFCYVLIRGRYPNIDKYLGRCMKYIIHVNPNVIKSAMAFRYQNRKNRISMTDCISYFMARQLGIKFLTGDKEFENLENVEFVKK